MVGACLSGPAQLNHPLPPPRLQVVSRLEAVLSQKRFTQLGGLQLEKDVRLLMGELGGSCAARHACKCRSDSASLLPRQYFCLTTLLMCPHRMCPPAVRAVLQAGCPT
jgi:hypothetical protein